MKVGNRGAITRFGMRVACLLRSLIFFILFFIVLQSEGGENDASSRSLRVPADNLQSVLFTPPLACNRIQSTELRLHVCFTCGQKNSLCP